jgi:hypothetical protein
MTRGKKICLIEEVISMPFFIKHIPYSTYHVILVEANEEKNAHGKDGEYLGFIDGESLEEVEVFGPFPSKEAALESDEAHVEGK